MPGKHVDGFHRVFGHGLHCRFQKAVYVPHPGRSNDPKLCQMRADRVHGLCHLANQKIAGSVLQEDGLMGLGLDRHEAHRRPCDGLANGRCIGRVRFLTPDIGLHIGRRHQPHIVALTGQLPCPGVGTGTGFDTDETRGQF